MRSANSRKRADALGLVDFKFHHLRGTHATLLIDKGVPVHIVAVRIGDDPAALLKNYAKRKEHMHCARQKANAETRCEDFSSV